MREVQTLLVDAKTEVKRAQAAEEEARAEAAARTLDAANVGHVAVAAEQVGLFSLSSVNRCGYA